jgi:hypothetical protein
MDSKNRSLSERKQQLIDEMMAAGTGGFSAAAPAEGPVAGYDPLMQKIDKVMKRRRKKKEEVSEAVYGGEEAKKKAEYEKRLKEMLPKRAFDPMGRELDPRSGKLLKKEEVELEEARDGKSAKDKDYSLRDWFKGGGWKQTGGKYDGKPCAKQPGQTTKPFCRDADDRAAMDKDERDRRAKKKRREDPDADRSGAAKNVTEENVAEEKDACYHKVKSRYKIWPSAYASGALVKCRKKGAKSWGEGGKKKD